MYSVYIFIYIISIYKYMYKLIILYITQCFVEEITCISWTLNESITCFLVCHCYISCLLLSQGYQT